MGEGGENGRRLYPGLKVREAKGECGMGMRNGYA